MFNKIIVSFAIMILTSTNSFAFMVPENSISLKFGTGEKQMYIAANPQCKYTKIFFDEAKETLSEYTVNVFLLKRPHLTKSFAMIDFILLGKTNEERVARFNDIIFNDSKDYQKLEQFPIFMKKSKKAQELEMVYSDLKDEKRCIDAFMIKQDIIALDANYKFDIKNVEELSITDSVLKRLDATHSPTIFDVKFEVLDWMRLVKSKEQFRVRCTK